MEKINPHEWLLKNRGAKVGDTVYRRNGYSHDILTLSDVILYGDIPSYKSDFPVVLMLENPGTASSEIATLEICEFEKIRDTKKGTIVLHPILKPIIGDQVLDFPNTITTIESFDNTNSRDFIPVKTKDFAFNLTLRSLTKIHISFGDKTIPLAEEDWHLVVNKDWTYLNKDVIFEIIERDFYSCDDEKCNIKNRCLEQGKPTMCLGKQSKIEVAKIII